MKFEYEIKRLFGIWAEELERNGEWVQASFVRVILEAFLKWYEE